MTDSALSSLLPPANMMAFIAALAQQQSELAQLAQRLAQPSLLLPDNDEASSTATTATTSYLDSLSVPLLPPAPPPPLDLCVALSGDSERAVREALRVNGEYRSVLVAHVQRIDEQLQAVHAKRRELQAAVARQNRSNVKRIAAVTDPRAPGGAYFVDPHGSAPPANADALRKRRRAAGSGAVLLESQFQSRPWKQRDRNALAAAVRSQTRERLTLQLQAEFGPRPPAELRLFAAKLRELVALSDAELDRAVDADAVDWLTVARAFEPERSATDCHVQWINRQSPTINTAPFDAAEKTRLRALAAQYNGANWPAIAAALGTARRPWQCFQAVQQDEQQNFKGRPWTDDEDQRLRELVERFGTDWLRVAAGLVSRTPAQCLHRWQKSRDPTIRRAKWQPDEDLQLRIATDAYGRGNWALIARHVHGRTDVQCRERYVNVLDPLVNNEPFSADEDARLLALATQHECSWTKVAQHMPGRTDGACWRRWRLLVPADVLDAYLAGRKRAWSVVPVSRDEPTARGVFKSKRTHRARRKSATTQDSESLRDEEQEEHEVEHEDDD